MLVPTEGMKVFVALEPIDMRKAANGLMLAVIDHQADPQSGDLYIFRNRQSSLIKAIFWHIDGFVLIQKRIEAHKFKFPKLRDNELMHLTKAQLKWLLSGFDFARISQKNERYFSDYC